MRRGALSQSGHCGKVVQVAAVGRIMSAVDPSALSERKARRAAAAVAAVLAFVAGAVLACTPPRPFDVELAVSATVDGAGALLPGSRGRLVFTAWHPNSRRRGPERFEVHQPAFTPDDPAGAPIRLRAVPNADCVVEDRPATGAGAPGIYQAVVAPRAPLALWPRSCHVDFEVLPAAIAGQSVRYTAKVIDPCGMDINPANNHADIVFGTVPPTAPARPAPLAAWPLALLVLAILAMARSARLRGTRSTRD